MVRRSRISYKSAVMILSGKDTKSVDRLDKALGGALLGVAGPLGPSALALIGPKNEIIKFGRLQLEQMSVKLQGLAVPERSQNVYAACAVLAISSFFEATTSILADAGWPNTDALRSDLERKAITGSSTSSEAEKTKVGFINALLNSDMPSPQSHETYSDLLDQLQEYFRRLGSWLEDFLPGLYEWDDLSLTSQKTLVSDLRLKLAQRSVDEFDAMFRRLASDVPELFVWVTLRESAANRRAIVEAISAKIESRFVETMQHVADVQMGLNGLRLSLDSVAESLSAPRGRWQKSLALLSNHEIRQPLIDFDSENVMGAVAPSAEDGYVNPTYKLALVKVGDHIAAEAWWSKVPARNDLQEFIATHLMLPHATEFPLLILGHPGAGKSILSRVLAAQLPVRAFTTVRVKLRDVAASSSILDQIESALHQTIHEPVRWPEFVEGLGASLPVVILDGFDELIQATGLSRSDYLEQARAFQQMEEAQGRPLVVIVTSRTAVADRARVPAGSVVVKLEPFSNEQVNQWVANWNRVNADNFRSRGIEPLTSIDVLRHRDLAIQPILLLMLALYDAAENGLRGEGEPLGRVVLYEQLLVKFVEREVTKQGRADPEIVRQHVEKELFRLAVVALGMFNRGKQIIREAELDEDFRGLLISAATSKESYDEGFYTRLTGAQQTLGRFFFIHRYEARDAVGVKDSLLDPADFGSLGQSFEFLHATFSEYLVARSISLISVTHAISTPSSASWQPVEAPTETPILRALMSFQALTKRRQVLLFLIEKFELLAPEERRKVVNLATSVLSNSLLPSRDSTFDGYRPVQLDEPTRYANYSFNMFLLLLVAEGGPVPLRRISKEGVKWWTRVGAFWRSLLDYDAWVEATEALSILREESDWRDNADTDDYSVAICPPASVSGSLERFERRRSIQDVVDAAKGGDIRSDRDGIDHELRSSLLLLNGVTASSVGLIQAMRPWIGSAADSFIFFNRERADGGYTARAQHVIAGALPLVLLRDDLLDGNALGAAFELLLAALPSPPLVDSSFASSVMHLALAHEEKLPTDFLVRLFDSTIAHRPQISSFEFHAPRARLSALLHARQGSGGGVVDWIAQVGAAIAEMDPIHNASGAPADFLGLLLYVESMGVPLEEAAPEFGSLISWIDRIDLVDLSYRAPSVVVDVLKTIDSWRVTSRRRPEFDYWIRNRLPDIIVSLPAVAGRMLGNVDFRRSEMQTAWRYSSDGGS